MEEVKMLDYQKLFRENKPALPPAPSPELIILTSRDQW